MESSPYVRTAGVCDERAVDERTENRIALNEKSEMQGEKKHQKKEASLVKS